MGDSRGKVVAYTTGCFLSGHTVAASFDAFQVLTIEMSKKIEEARFAGAPPLRARSSSRKHTQMFCDGFRATGFGTSGQLCRWVTGRTRHQKVFICLLSSTE